MSNDDQVELERRRQSSEDIDDNFYKLMYYLSAVGLCLEDENVFPSNIIDYKNYEGITEEDRKNIVAASLLFPPSILIEKVIVLVEVGNPLLKGSNVEFVKFTEATTILRMGVNLSLEGNIVIEEKTIEVNKFMVCTDYFIAHYYTNPIKHENWRLDEKLRTLPRKLTRARTVSKSFIAPSDFPPKKPSTSHYPRFRIAMFILKLLLSAALITICWLKLSTTYLSILKINFRVFSVIVGCITMVVEIWSITVVFWKNGFCNGKLLLWLLAFFTLIPIVACSLFFAEYFQYYFLPNIKDPWIDAILACDGALLLLCFIDCFVKNVVECCL